MATNRRSTERRYEGLRRRTKAVGTVSMVNIGSRFFNGWENNVKDADAIPLRDKGADACTVAADGRKEEIFPPAPMRKEDANHGSMCDGETHINEAIGQLAPFFKSKLSRT